MRGGEETRGRMGGEEGGRGGGERGGEGEEGEEKGKKE